MNNELTIVLLLKDRALFTWRWFEYYNKISLPFKILVADGGKDKSIEKLANKSLFPNLDYEYIRYPFDADTILFFKKTCDVLSRVHTKYVLLASNDDFYISNALSKNVEFLNKNSDYVASRGNIYNFEISSLDKSNNKKDIYGKMINILKIFKSESNTENSALKRVRVFSEFCDSLWHDICHTEKLKESWQILSDSNITDLELADNFINYLLVAEGKVHRGEGLYMLHQSHIEGLGHELVKIDPLEPIMTKTWSEDVTKIFNLTAKKVSEIDKISAKESYFRVMQYYICFILGKNTIQSRLWRKLAIRPRKIFAFSNILSRENKIRIFLREFYTRIKKRIQENRSEKVIKSFLYYEDIKTIKDFLLNNTNEK